MYSASTENGAIGSMSPWKASTDTGGPSGQTRSSPTPATGAIAATRSVAQAKYAAIAAPPETPVAYTRSGSTQSNWPTCSIAVSTNSTSSRPATPGMADAAGDPLGLRREHRDAAAGGRLAQPGSG